MSSDNTTFTKIVNMLEEMVKCLDGETWKPLRMTLRLFKLGETNTILRQKHIDRFETFCLSNKNAIMETNVELLNETELHYSDGVYVDFKGAFEALGEDADSLWQHLICIAMDFDASLSKMLNIVQSSLKEGDVDMSSMLNKSLAVVDDIMNKNGGQSMDFNEIIKSALDSDVFKELTKSMQGILQNVTKPPE